MIHWRLVSDESRGDAAPPSLPADRTFVVQFRPAPRRAPEGGSHGRVEHLVTGLAARFDTWRELRLFVERVLLDEGRPPPSGTDSHGGPA